MSKLILEVFRVRDASFILVSYNNTFWSKHKHKDYVNITADKLIEYINFLGNNILGKVTAEGYTSSIQIFTYSVGTSAIGLQLLGTSAIGLLRLDLNYWVLRRFDFCDWTSIVGYFGDSTSR